MTAPSGQSNRTIFSLPLHSTAYGRWRRSTQNGRRRSRSKRYSKAIRKLSSAGGAKALLTVIAASHSGMTTEEFHGTVKEWLTTARHPRFKRPYNELVYQPMQELLAYLRANGFKTFIVSGGGVEFMRAWVEKTYGIPPEQVVGSVGEQKFELHGRKPVLRKLPAVDFVDDKEGKPIGIQKFIDRRPILAFGNSDGDLQMLQWTAGGTACVSWAWSITLCASVYGSDDCTSHIGNSDKALDEASARGWTVVDMKKDWKKVFPFPAYTPI